MARLMAVAVAAVVLFASAQAHAITWQWNYIHGSQADGATGPGVNSGLMDEANFVGESIAIYPTSSGTGGFPGAGDTFVGYSFFRLNDFSLGGAGLVPAPDGTFTYRLDHEISGAIFFTGKHVDAQNFVFTSAELRVFFDAGATCVVPGCTAPTAGYTLATFTNLATVTDGTLVETGDALGVGGVLGATVADGASNFIFALTDILSTLNECGPTGDAACGPFELTTASGDLLAFTDNNNNLCDATTCFSSFAAILAAGNALFGNAFAPGAINTHSQNDGSVEKTAEAVPLPASLLLLGAGMSAAAFWARRRSMV